MANAAVKMNGIQTGYESHKHKRLSNVSQPPLPVDGNSATDESSTMHIHLPRDVCTVMAAALATTCLAAQKAWYPR